MGIEESKMLQNQIPHFLQGPASQSTFSSLPSSRQASSCAGLLSDLSVVVNAEWSLVKSVKRTHNK